MTTINDLKIKDEDFADLDIESLSDRPSADGMSAQKLKERFDAGSKRVVKPKYNQLIELLNSSEGADNIGITPIDGVAGYSVQQILTAVKLLLDDKQSIEQSNIDVGKKFDTAEAQALVKEISFSEGSGVFTITKYDGSTQTIDTAIEKVALDVRLDGQQFVLTLVDGTEQRVDLSVFLTQTEVKNSDTITLAIESGVIVARLASGSVTMAHLNPEVTAYIEAKEQSAANSAASASVSEQNALNSANSAEQSHQNAKNCQEQACLCATQAELSRKAAATSEQNAKTSEQAAKQSETKSAASEANAKASEEKAASSEKNASTSEQNAKTSEQAAKESETKAATSEENAKKSEENAEQYATELQGSKEEAAASAASAAESAAKAEAEAKKAADIAGGDFVTGSELQAHLDAENPHNIDAQKVGLGNVPNVETNDQTPTYEVPAENAELTSGEKLSIAFGKIAKAVSSFISHLTNKENPHKVTAEQAGAVKTDLSNVDNDVFKAKAEEAGAGGIDGVLEIEKGGTGAENAKDAIANLGAYPDVVYVEETGTDLNDFIENGLYYFESTNAPANVPAGSNGWLQVMNSNNEDKFVVKQIWYRYGTINTNDYYTYVRTRNPVGSWGGWRRISVFTSGNVLAYPVIAPNGTDYGTARVRNIKAGTSDLTAGVSALSNGDIYLVYE